MLNWRLIKVIILLPGTLLVFIPAAVLLLSRGTPLAPEFQYPMEVTSLVAAVVIAAGILLAISSTRLFIRSGQATPAPWNPPQALIVDGPYRYTRNPMISGVIIVLTGESILFNSWPLLLWTLLFLAAKNEYIKRVEEKALARR
ncbi:MAG: methyltransferase [Desulfobacteraceae bacterium]|jgi:protein-S-isoprenylcysteine O-methyltransferase Ste14|nr:methyltransferase [Desulfobacteraceae bacterium]